MYMFIYNGRLNYDYVQMFYIIEQEEHMTHFVLRSILSLSPYVVMMMMILMMMMMIAMMMMVIGRGYEYSFTPI